MAGRKAEKKVGRKAEMWVESKVDMLVGSKTGSKAHRLVVMRAGMRVDDWVATKVAQKAVYWAV